MSRTVGRPGPGSQPVTSLNTRPLCVACGCGQGHSHRGDEPFASTPPPTRVRRGWQLRSGARTARGICGRRSSSLPAAGAARRSDEARGDRSCGEQGSEAWRPPRPKRHRVIDQGGSALEADVSKADPVLHRVGRFAVRAIAAAFRDPGLAPIQIVSSLSRLRWRTSRISTSSAAVARKPYGCRRRIARPRPELCQPCIRSTITTSPAADHGEIRIAHQLVDVSGYQLPGAQMRPNRGARQVDHGKTRTTHRCCACRTRRPFGE